MDIFDLVACHQKLKIIVLKRLSLKDTIILQYLALPSWVLLNEQILIEEVNKVRKRIESSPTSYNKDSPCFDVRQPQAEPFRLAEN